MALCFCFFNGEFVFFNGEIVFLMVSLTILGATGSVGSSALEIVRSRRDEFEIVALTAHSNERALEALEAEFRPRFTALGEDGDGAILEASSMRADIVLVAISGLAALVPALEAIKQTKRLAIANKECLVSAGRIIMQRAGYYGCEILPVDSEHNALFQILDRRERDFLKRIVLTASGGAFRDLPISEFGSITIEQALKHPNWSMGRKNTIDSATMMNKGLEIIEAHNLFDIGSDRIDVLIHRQSIVHALVEYCDGCVVAHLSSADMRLPIAYALDYPVRNSIEGVGYGDYLDLTEIGSLDFESADTERFPCLSYAREALLQGGVAPAVLNAVNEVAVDSFLLGELDFCGISAVVGSVLSSADMSYDVCDVSAILACDREARLLARDFIKARL